MRYLYLIISILFITTTINGQNFIPNGEYIIISAQNEKVLDVAGAKKDNGTNIKVWDYNGQDNQVFALEFADNGEFIMNSKHSRKNLEVANGSTQDLANIQLWEMNNTPAQKFKLQPVENTDMFMIVNINSDKVITLDPNSGNVFQMSKPSVDGKQGGNLHQCWRFAQRLSLQNVGSNKKLDVPHGTKNAGTRLIIYESNNGLPQVFDLIPVVNSDEYYIRSVASSLYLTVENNTLAANVHVVQTYFNVLSPQKFKLEQLVEYTYHITPSNSPLVISVQGNSKNNGAMVVLADKSPTASQHWKLFTYDPKSAAQHAKEELKEAGKKAVDNVKDAGKKAKDKLKKLFKK